MNSENYQTSFDLFECLAVSEPAQIFHLTPASIEPTKDRINLPTELATHLAQPDAFAYYCFAKDNPTKNCSHRYFITYQRSLWDEYTVLRQWGRLGAERQFSRAEHYQQPTPAQKQVSRLIRRRLRRGYRLSYAA